MTQATTMEISQGALQRAHGIFPTAMVKPDETPENSRLWELFDSIKPSNLSWAEWTRRAKVSSSFFTDVRKKGTKPGYDTLTRVLGVIGMTLSEFQNLDSDRDGGPIQSLRSPSALFAGEEQARDVPMLGTAQAADFEVSADGAMVFAEQMDVHLNEVIDMIRRPARLKGKRSAYALTVRGTSLRPKFDDGDPIYVDPDDRPQIGDIVIVQLLKRDADGEGAIASVLVKELVRRTAEYIELEQYNPPLRFRVATREVAQIHRWIPWRDLVVF